MHLRLSRAPLLLASCVPAVSLREGGNGKPSTKQPNHRPLSLSLSIYISLSFSVPAVLFGCHDYDPSGQAPLLFMSASHPPRSSSVVKSMAVVVVVALEDIDVVRELTIPSAEPLVLRTVLVTLSVVDVAGDAGCC